MHKVCIYIYFRGGEELTRTCIAAIRDFTDPGAYDLVLVDDGSPDGLGDRFIADGFTVVKHAENKGIPAAINTCLLHEAKLKFLIQNDVLVSNNWLPPLLEFRQEHPELLYVSPMAFDNDEKDPFRGDHIAFNEKIEKHRPLLSRYIADMYWGGAWLCDHRIIDAVGLYNEELRYYCDDLDFCLRIREKGVAVASIGTSLVFHKNNMTMRNEEYTRRFADMKELFERTWPHEKQMSIPSWKRLDTVQYLHPTCERMYTYDEPWRSACSMNARFWLNQD